MAQIKRQVRQSLLIVGEGGCEQTFLKYLRSLYCTGGAGVAVKGVLEDARTRLFALDQLLGYFEGRTAPPQRKRF